MWIEGFNEFGINGLQDLPRTGRPSKIPQKKLIIIEQQIAENPSGWSAKQVMDLIYEKSGVKYHEVHVYGLLHKWGYTSKVAAKRFVNSATTQEKLVCIKVHAQINLITQKDLRSTKPFYNTCQTVVMRKSSYNYKKK